MYRHDELTLDEISMQHWNSLPLDKLRKGESLPHQQIEENCRAYLTQAMGNDFMQGHDDTAELDCYMGKKDEEGWYLEAYRRNLSFILIADPLTDGDVRDTLLGNSYRPAVLLCLDNLMKKEDVDSFFSDDHFRSLGYDHNKISLSDRDYLREKLEAAKQSNKERYGMREELEVQDDGRFEGILETMQSDTMTRPADGLYMKLWRKKYYWFLRSQKEYQSIINQVIGNLDKEDIWVILDRKKKDYFSYLPGLDFSDWIMKAIREKKPQL